MCHKPSFAVDQTIASHHADNATDETYTNAETVVVKPPIKPKPLSPPPLMPRAKSQGAIAEDFRSKAERRKSYKIAVQRRAEQPGRFRSSPNISPADTPNTSPGILRNKAIRPRTAIREEIYGDCKHRQFPLLNTSWQIIYKERRFWSYWRKTISLAFQLSIKKLHHECVRGHWPFPIWEPLGLVPGKCGQKCLRWISRKGENNSNSM